MKRLISRLEEMRNDTLSTVTIKLSRVDDAVALGKALQEIKSFAGGGGDCILYAASDEHDEPTKMGSVGHDVMIKSIEVTHGEEK